MHNNNKILCYIIMKPNQEVLIKKFSIKKTRKYGSKFHEKSSGQIKKEINRFIKSKFANGINSGF